MPRGERHDTRHIKADREFAEEVDRRISQHLMDSVLPHLELIQEEVAMNTALLSELIHALEQNGVISSEQREGIYSNARETVPHLLLEHLRNLERVTKERREFIEQHAEGAD